MRISLSVFSAAGLLFSIYIPAISAITLEQFQPIKGFSPACVNAYKTPLSGCEASDFKSGSCSKDCIAFLEALTQVLTSECGDTSASPNTLIGSFFKKEGTSNLCPNVLSDSKASIGGGQGDRAISTLSISQSPSSYTTGAFPTTEPDESTLSSSSTSTSADAEATTTQLAVVRTTVSPEVLNEATTTHLAVVRTTVSPQISTTIRSSPSSTDAIRTKPSTTPASSDSETTYNGGGGGGGSPLDVGSSSSSHKYRIGAWMLGVMVGSTGLALLLW